MKKNFFPMILAFAMILVDRITKWLSQGPLRDAGGSFVVFKNVLGLRYVENRGAAFGIFQGHATGLAIVTAAVILAILAYLLFFSKNLPALPRYSAWLLLGGAVGNWLDRVFLGYVVDFLEILLFDFAVFNWADCCVTVGFCLMAGWIVFSKEEGKGHG